MQTIEVPLKIVLPRDIKGTIALALELDRSIIGNKSPATVGDIYVIIIEMEDTRNLQDEYKGLAVEQIIDCLAKKRSALEIAIENIERDYNAGTIIRSANNFNASKVHIIGRRKLNRRGAMCTDKYLELVYWPDRESFVQDQRMRGREVVAVENNIDGAKPLADKKFIQPTTLLFGSEGNGITPKLLAEVDDIREIESLGSTRSINVGVAAGIAMYEWARQCILGRTRAKSTREGNRPRYDKLGIKGAKNV